LFDRSFKSLRAALTALRSAEGALLLVVLLTGASIRGLYLREATEDPAFSHPAIDAGFDDYCARKLAVPGWVPPAHLTDPEIDKRPYLRPPGYPWFLAAIYAVTGGSYVAPRLVQMLLGLASAVFAWRIGRRWFSPAVGLAWSAILVLYWSPVYWEGELHEVALLVFLLLASVESLGRWSESPRVGRAMAAGAILGIGALVRPNALFLLLFALIWMAWIARRRGARTLPSGAGLLAAAALVIAPATIRNARVAGDPVLISTNFGINLFIGNNEKSAGFVSANLGEYGAFRNCYDYPAVARKVERELGRPLKDSEISAHFTGKALTFVRENPNRFLWLLMRKTIFFWGPDEIPHNKVDALEREHSKILRWLPGNFPLLLSGGLLGLFFACRSSSKKPGGDLGSRREVIVLVLGFTVAWFLSVVPFFVAARYRAPILPFLMLFSAVAIHELVALALGRRLVAFAAWVAGFGSTSSRTWRSGTWTGGGLGASRASPSSPSRNSSRLSRPGPEHRTRSFGWPSPWPASDGRTRRSCTIDRSPRPTPTTPVRSRTSAP
jgi:4-amino-4-deoxy-L-arabinose transferase-like glycosyltransferase